MEERFSKLSRFCVAAAILAAAIADPVVEAASNAGWFGRGVFTDHSNADVFPALTAGVAILALYLLGKARAILDGRALPRRLWTLLPAIFGVQLVVLFVMETVEQIVVRGGVLGPTIWLGGPATVSLTIHAAFCVAFTSLLARSARGLAKTTLRVLRIIRAIATFSVSCEIFVPLPRGNRPSRKNLPLLCRIGERAPPAMPASSS